LNPILASIIDHPKPQGTILKKDWSIEEKAFKEGVQSFLAMIEPANSICAHKKTEKNLQEQAVSDVIIKTEAVEPVVGPVAKMQPEAPEAQMPKEVQMTTDLDDLFGLPSKNEETKKEEPKKEETKKEEVFASAGKESSFENFPPAAPAVEPAPAKQSEPAPAKSERTKAPSEISLCDGFDAATFKSKVMVLVDSILETTPDIDLEQMQGSIDEYSVNISVDAYRSDIDSIANHIAEIQAKRDSIISPLIKLSATVLAMDETLDFVVNIGVSCSSASNRERRVSEVHYMAGDLFKKFMRVRHLHDQYDKMYRHLGSQMEALSRLLTAQIERAKQVYLGNQRHSDLKELHEKRMVSKAPIEHTSLDYTQEINRMAEESKLMKQESPQMPFDVDAKTPSKPTQAVEGLSELETFSAAPVKPLEKFKKGVIEW
jgi:hypothetical protein